MAEAQGARWARIAIRVVALGLVVLLVLRLWHLWGQHPVDLSAIDVPIMALAAAFSFVSFVSYGAVWPLILKRIGVAPPPGLIRIFLQSQLAKYLPGSVWHYASRIGLARSRGIPVRLTVLSLGLELAGSILAALAMALLLLPVEIGIPIALVGAGVALAVSRGRVRRRIVEPLLALVRRVVPVTASDQRSAMRALLPTAALYVPVWILYGVALWLSGRALFPIPADEMLYFTGAFAVGWLVGALAIFAPGGIGVREAVLAALLAPRVGQTEAIVIAATSRILLTGADLVGGGGAILLPRVNLRRVAGAAE